MYIPPHFKQNSTEEAIEIIRNNSFGTLVSQVEGKPWATHLPMLVREAESGDLILHGHVSRGNLQGKSFSPDEVVLAIFQGPHAYISSTWYTIENVPTWNYAAVHAYGTIRILEGEGLRKSLGELMDTFESYTDTHLSIDDLPQPYVHRQMNGVIGFEMKVTDLQCSFKLSQNRDAQSHQQVIAALEQSEHDAERQTAEMMKKHSPHSKE